MGIRQHIFGIGAYLLALLILSTGTLQFFEPHTTIDTQAAVNQHFHFDYDHVREKGPYLNLKAAVLVNYDNGEVLYSKHGDDVRPIASISKLISAMVILDAGIDLDHNTETITKADAYRSSKSRLTVGSQMTLRDLLHAMLLCSDNRAARALARATAGSIDAFAALMNKKAAELGLSHSRFYEPSGLDQRNVSTAIEVAKMLHYAFEYPTIAKITSKKRYEATYLNRKRYNKLPMGNTNLLIWSPYKVMAGKTGYIQASDYCLGTIVRNKTGQRLTAVVLGVPGDKLRFKEARKLLNWGFKETT
ncbi:MAG TPA: serine hydrolase [candidate division Zixibacteria bacterium]|nr:serine hydrolase [candidate division Zixibacteria bacterium]